MDTLQTALWALGLFTALRAVVAIVRVCYAHWGRNSLQQRYGRGSWAVVTGASFGIGCAFAGELAAQGFNLVLLARTVDRLQSLSETLQRTHHITVEVLPVDLCDSTVYEKLSVVMMGKKWTVLVNNASALVFKEFTHLTRSEVQGLIDLNVKSVAELTHLFGQLGQSRKALINLSSLTGVLPLPMLSLYSGTKAFTKAFSEALASEGHFDVLCLSPVCVSSNMTFNLTASVLENPDSYSQASLQTLGRVSWSAGSLRQDCLHTLVELLPFSVVKTGFQSLVRVLHFLTIEPTRHESS